jgi:O-antigen/teichoic acid export membrane protein
MAAPPDSELRQRTIRGGAATVLAQSVRFGLQMGSTMVLGRLLTPGDFGLVAMVTSVTGVMAVLRDAGLGAATVQKPAITHEEVSTLFWLNVGLGAALALVALALGPVLGWLYAEPRLVAVTTVLAGLFFINALAMQHHALLRRQMRFRALSVIETVSMAAGIAVAIAMALRGYRYWSLVGMSATSTLVSVGAAWWVQRWRPGQPSQFRAVAAMLKFGGFLTFNHFLNYLFRNVDNILIGWRWGAGPLGMYAKAYALLMLPIQQINTPINSVAIAALSRVQDDPGKLRRYFLGGFGIVSSVILPVVVGTFVFADEIIALVLGSQWADSVDLFRYLAPAALVGALSHPLGWLMWATGRADRLFAIGLFWCGLCLLGFVLGLPYGPAGVALGFSIATCVAAWPHAAYLIRGTSVRMRDLLGTLARPLCAVTVAGVAAWMVRPFLSIEWPLLLRLLGGAVVVAAIYASILLLVFRQWPFYRNLLRELRSPAPAH